MFCGLRTRDRRYFGVKGGNLKENQSVVVERFVWMDKVRFVLGASEKRHGINMEGY